MRSASLKMIIMVLILLAADWPVCLPETSELGHIIWHMKSDYYCILVENINCVEMHLFQLEMPKIYIKRLGIFCFNPMQKNFRRQRGLNRVAIKRLRVSTIICCKKLDLFIIFIIRSCFNVKSLSPREWPSKTVSSKLQPDGIRFKWDKTWLYLTLQDQKLADHTWTSTVGDVA